VRLDVKPGGRPLLHPLRPDVDVGLPRLHDVLRHIGEAGRPVDLQRRAPSLHPRRKDQIRIAHRVIGVQVGDEGRLQAVRRERRDAFLRRRRGAPDDARTEIDEVRRVGDDNRRRRARAQRICRWRASAEEHDLRARRRRCLQRRDDQD